MRYLDPKNTIPIMQRQLKEHKWELYRKSKGSWYVYKKDSSKIKILINEDSVDIVTEMWHKKYGRSQLIRREIDMGDFNKILKNLRVHTGKGEVLKRTK